MAVDRRPSQQDLSWFIDLYNQEKLNLEPPYQRKSVWLPKDKRFFLDTIFNNYPCPAIYIQKDTDENFSTVYNVVDGKQRLTTVIDFYRNKIRLDNTFHDERLDGKKWNEITDVTLKRNFLNYSFTVETLDSMDNTSWNDVFDRLNRNAKTLSDQELRHARFNGWLVNRSENEAEDPLWKKIKVSTTSKARRMKDVEFISILLLIILENKIVGFPQSALDRLYEKYEKIGDIDEDKFFENSSFEPMPGGEEDVNKFNEKISEFVYDSDIVEQFEEKLSSIKRFLVSLNENSTILTENKVFGKRRTTHLYTLWSYLVLMEIPKDILLFKNRYESFFVHYEEYESNTDASMSLLNNEQADCIKAYYQNSIGAATEEPQRINRLEALSNFLKIID